MERKSHLREVLQNYKVSEFMTTNILVGKEEFPLSHITRLFNELRIHHLPIVNDDNQVKGIITANDLLRKFSMMMEMGQTLESGDQNEGQIVADCITRELVHCSPEDSILTAIRKFSKGKFHALPILSDGELVGIFTAEDLIRFLDKVCQ